MKRKINWTNTLFLTMTPLLGITGTVWLAFNHSIYWQTVLFTFILSYATGLAITAGYHRLFSHLTYKASPIVKVLYGLVGLSAFEGSILEWCSDHRTHHRYVDTEKDPYNINQGFWYAHIGWLLVNDPSSRTFNNVPDLKQDKFLMLQHKYANPLSVLIGIVMPTVACGLFWGDWLGGFFIAAMLRIVLAQHLTFCINSVCHVFGKKNFSEKQTARDNWFTAFFTFGEGYHNFHHTFPADYRNGIRFYHYDPTKWLIYLLAKVGLASELKKVELKQIVSAKINYYEKWFKLRGDCKTATTYYRERFSPARLKTINLMHNVENANKAYQGFKENAQSLYKTKYLKSYKLRKRVYRNAIRQQKKALSDSLGSLGHIFKQCPSTISA